MNPRSKIKTLFPYLSATTSFKVTSEPTPQYNCIAWAAGDDTHWWWPVEGKYWPPGVPLEVTLHAFKQAFALLGYVDAEDMSLESGIEKVAIYTYANGEPTHAARQLNNGQWTFKLGDLWDISHNAPHGVTGMRYGDVAAIMKRPSLTLA